MPGSSSILALANVSKEENGQRSHLEKALSSPESYQSLLLLLLSNVFKNIIFITYPVFSSCFSRSIGLLLHIISYQKRKSYEMISRFNHGTGKQVCMAESPQTMPQPLLYRVTTVGDKWPEQTNQSLSTLKLGAESLFIFVASRERVVRQSSESKSARFRWLCPMFTDISSRRKGSARAESRGTGALRGCWDP